MPTSELVLSPPQAAVESDPAAAVPQAVGPTSAVQEPRGELAPPALLSDRIAMTAAVLLPLAGCLVAAVLLWQQGWMGWLHLGMLLVGWAATTLGITIGFHRLLTHRAFETYGWVRAGWTLLGALSVQGSPLVWCAVHRRHHQRERPGSAGFWHVRDGAGRARRTCRG